MADFGIKVSEPGIDVLTALPRQLYYSSKYDTLKAKTVATTTQTFLGINANQTYTIAHGLSYAPAFRVHVKVTSNEYCAIPFANFFSDISGRVATMQAYVDTTNLYIRVSGFVGADISLTFKYYIFYNQLD